MLFEFHEAVGEKTKQTNKQTNKKHLFAKKGKKKIIMNNIKFSPRQLIQI